MSSGMLTMKISGLDKLQDALQELPKATQRAVLLRVLKRAGQPIADAAKGFARDDTGELRNSIQVSTNQINSAGKAEFAAAMRSGLGQEAAVKALRGARRAASGGGSSAQIFVGPTNAKTKKNAIKRIVNEYGSVKMPAQPYMRPAYDGHKDQALSIIRTDMMDEIQRTAARVAKRAAAKAARGK